MTLTTLNMGGSGSSETLVPIYQITLYLIPQDRGFGLGKFEVTLQKYRERIYSLYVL